MPQTFNYHLRCVWKLVTHCGERPIPPLTLCRHVTPRHDRVTILYTLWTILPSYHDTKKSSGHGYGEVVKGRNLNIFKTSVAHVRNLMFCNGVIRSHGCQTVFKDRGVLTNSYYHLYCDLGVSL